MSFIPDNGNPGFQSSGAFVGEIRMWGSNLPPPPRWLDCFGQTLIVLDYPELYDVIGGGYGGDGVTFNLPNLTNRCALGSTTNTVATYGGASSVTLVQDNLPAHNHDINDPGHAHGGNVLDPGHSHSIDISDSGHGHTININDPAHAHAINDPGHTHNQTYTDQQAAPGATWGANQGGTVQTGNSVTGIEIVTAFTNITASADTNGTGITASSAEAHTGISMTANPNTTGITIGSTGIALPFPIIPLYLGLRFLIRVRP